MHKYQPRIHILRHLTKKDTELVYSIDFPQTQFVAVTAYQNDLVSFWFYLVQLSNAFPRRSL